MYLFCRLTPLMSIPSNMKARRVASIEIQQVSLSLGGNRNVPFSRRLYQIAKPSRSQYSILTRSARRFRNTNKCPENGSWPMISRVIRERPSNPRRMSACSRQRYIRTAGGSLNMASSCIPSRRSRRAASRCRSGFGYGAGDRYLVRHRSRLASMKLRRYYLFEVFFYLFSWA